MELERLSALAAAASPELAVGRWSALGARGRQLRVRRGCRAARALTAQAMPASGGVWGAGRLPESGVAAVALRTL
eukprot:7572690-Alexandrium_andersonii.AAC.1